MRKLTEETKKKIGDSLRGKKKIFSEQAIENIRNAAAKRRGIKRGPRSDEDKKKISDATTGVKKTITKPNSGRYVKGRIRTTEEIEKTKLALAERRAICAEKRKEKEKQKQLLREEREKNRKDSRNNSRHYKWRTEVKKRDGNKCMRCGSIDKLHAHHIIPWMKNKELRYDLNNGITLCASCHSKEEWKGRERPSSKGYKFTDEQKKRLSDAHRRNK